MFSRRLLRCLMASKHPMVADPTGLLREGGLRGGECGVYARGRCLHCLPCRLASACFRCLPVLPACACAGCKCTCGAGTGGSQARAARLHPVRVASPPGRDGLPQVQANGGGLGQGAYRCVLLDTLLSRFISQDARIYRLALDKEYLVLEVFCLL